MNKLFLVVLVLLLAGCDFHEMTRAEVITAVKECKDAGMRPQIMVRYWDYAIAKVNCLEAQ